MMVDRPSSPAPGRTIVNSIKEWSKGLIDVRFRLIDNARKMGINREIGHCLKSQ